MEILSLNGSSIFIEILDCFTTRQVIKSQSTFSMSIRIYLTNIIYLVIRLFHFFRAVSNWRAKLLCSTQKGQFVLYKQVIVG